MKVLKSIALLFLMSATSFSAEVVHWYEIAISGTGSGKTFTGSSAWDPAEMARRLAFPEPIVLENLRAVFGGGAGNLPMGWHPNDDVLKVYILPRVILYFSELPGDPAAPAKK